MSKHEIPMRIRVVGPLSGVTMKVQRGRTELLDAIKKSRKELVFEFPLTVDLSNSAPNFLGKYAQGPKDSRFVYVNSGTYAGQPGICWNRRAKLSLMNITRDQIRKVIGSAKGKLEVSFNGTGRDGGPTCANVNGIEWKVVEK
jgi:uncharacterized protein DUF5990